MDDEEAMNVLVSSLDDLITEIDFLPNDESDQKFGLGLRDLKLLIGEDETRAFCWNRIGEWKSVRQEAKTQGARGKGSPNKKSKSCPPANA